MQEFFTSAVAKEEEMAAQWIFGQEIGDDSREPIEAFAHVGGLSAGVDLQMRNEADHDWRLAPSVIRTWRTG
jgi:hypothetical protein